MFDVLEVSQPFWDAKSVIAKITNQIDFFVEHIYSSLLVKHRVKMQLNFEGPILAQLRGSVVPCRQIGDK